MQRIAIRERVAATLAAVIMLGFVVYALLGRELKIGLSMGMLEALRGRWAAGCMT